MQRIHNKHGLQSFSFEVLEESALENLNELEQWWLDQMCGHPKSLNLASVAEAPARGQKRSSATKIKISEAAILRTAKTWTDERKAAFSKARTGAGNPSFGKPRAHGLSTRRRPVERTDVALKLVTLYSSLSDVKKDGFNPFSVASACRSDRIHRGYLWKFTKNDIE